MNPCARLVWALHAEQHVDLTGKWAGWKLRGRELVSPHGDRITPQRLAALLYMESLVKQKPASSPDNVVSLRGSASRSVRRDGP